MGRFNLGRIGAPSGKEDNPTRKEQRKIRRKNGDNAC